MARRRPSGRRRLFPGLCLLLAVGALLTGCGGARPSAPTASDQAAPVVAAPPPPAITLPAPVPGEPPRRAESRDAIGKSAAELRVLFGEPGLLRREPPSEVWQYTAQSVPGQNAVPGQNSGPSTGCVLIFVLYPDGDTLRVNHAQSLPRRRGNPVGDADCMEALLKVPPVSITAQPGS